MLLKEKNEIIEQRDKKYWAEGSNHKGSEQKAAEEKRKWGGKGKDTPSS